MLHISFTLMSIFMPWSTTWSSQISLPTTEGWYIFERGLLGRITESRSLVLLEESTGNLLVAFIETPVQNIPYVPSVVGAGGVCDIQPREELLSNCVLPSGCLQLSVMFCFDDGNSSILCSQGSLCVSRWVYVVCIDFSIELVWSYQLRCQTHLLLQSEFIFVN